MKTAISVDSHLLQEADQAARQMGLSRSRLFSLAVQDYLRHRRQAEVVAQLNQVYSGELDQAERRLMPRVKAKFRATIKEGW